MSERLAIIMPVYNEEECVSTVLDEWIEALDKVGVNYLLMAIDDGSKDNSLNILKAYEKKFPKKVKALHHENRGHGQSCVAGYKMAIAENFDFILQIDSDGQCDPIYFKAFWDLRDKSPVFGYRKTRGDGAARWWISRLVSLVGFLGTGTWTKDPNVPYRLMRKEQLIACIDYVPENFHLANVLLCLKLKQKYKLHWVDIHFRDRIGGMASIKKFSFFKQGLKLIYQLWTS